MTNLTVQTINSTFVVDSSLLAYELGIEHDSLKKNIKVYKDDFEELGNLSTDSRGVIGTSSYVSFYYLNEDQCYLALTYSNNTQQVRKAKVNLVKAFKAAREALVESNQPKLPSSYKEALLALVEAEEEKERLQIKAAEAESKVAVLAPKAEVYDIVVASDKLLGMGDAAKIINSPGLGRNNLMRLLRDERVLQHTNLPFQRYVSSGYFEVVEVDTYAGLKTTCKVTQKGLSFLIRLLKDKGYTVPSKAA